MKIFTIDNPGFLDNLNNNDVQAFIKGNKIILCPNTSYSSDYSIIETGGYIPHLKMFGTVYKYCHKCEEWVNISCYIKNKYSKDGYKNICKSCDNKIRRERYAKFKAVT